MSRLFVLLAAICGWLAIGCSDSGSSDGSGGASVGGNASGGSPDVMTPNPDGTCEVGYSLKKKADSSEMVCTKDHHGGGGSGSGGSLGGSGGSSPDGGNLSPADSGLGGGSGGNGGTLSPDAALPVEQCPYWEDITDDRDPCLLAGRWTEMTDGWVEITVTKTSSTMCTVVLEGENIMFTGTFTGQTLPIVDEFKLDGQMETDTIDIDEGGSLIINRSVNGNREGQEEFFRND